MKGLNIKLHLKNNIDKIFDKLREEGLDGIFSETQNTENSYPINGYSEIQECDLTIKKIPAGQPKNYNDYRKLIQNLDSMIHIAYEYTLSKETFQCIKDKLIEEISFIQNTMNISLENNYIGQYSCLIKCYECILRLLQYFR